jgi:hypothetical protein
MKSNPPLFWRTRNGKLINVDDMDDNHVRNAFKMLLRNLQNTEKKNSKSVMKPTLNGDMAQEFNDSYYSDVDDIQWDNGQFYKE